MTSPRRVIAFGEALIDEFPDDRVVAGAPLHFTARLASFGWHAYLATRLGSDDDGLAVAETLRTFGVDDALVEIDADLPTGTTTIEMDGSSHTFTIAEPVAWDMIEGPDPVPAHEVFYFGTLALRNETSRSSWRRMVAASPALTVTDVNLRDPYVDAAIVREVIEAAHIVKTNDDELERVQELLDLPAGSPTAIFDAGPEWLAITHGPSGAELWHRDGERWSSPGIDAEVVDTVGAGDAFTAALVDALASGVGGDAAVDRANRHAAATVARRGGLPEIPKEAPARSTLLD